MKWLKKLLSNGAAEAIEIKPSPAAPPKEIPAGYLGDLQKTGILCQLFSAPREARNENWLRAFYAAAPAASFRAGEPQVQVGPDGFPYFVLLMPEPQKSFQCFVLEHMVRDFLLAQGLGVVIEPHGLQPQSLQPQSLHPQSLQPLWVFSHGDLVQLATIGTFEPQALTSAQTVAGREVLAAEEQVLTGQPSEQLLPAATRAVLRHHFSQQGIPDMHVCLMSRVTPAGPERSLVFDAVPERFQTEEHYNNTMRSVAWFLPRHYQYSALARSSLANSFQPL